MSRKSIPALPHDGDSIDPSAREAADSLYSKRVVPEAEQSLMFAILENAINDFQRYFVARNQKKKRQYQEAVDWILGKNSDWLFSFENICENVGLNPSYLRRRLQAWAEHRGHMSAYSRSDQFYPAKRFKRRSLR